MGHAMTRPLETNVGFLAQTGDRAKAAERAVANWPIAADLITLALTIPLSPANETRK
jgi:hypothetical protein